MASTWPDASVRASAMSAPGSVATGRSRSRAVNRRTLAPVSVSQPRGSRHGVRAIRTIPVGSRHHEIRGWPMVTAPSASISTSPSMGRIRSPANPVVASRQRTRIRVTIRSRGYGDGKCSMMSLRMKRLVRPTRRSGPTGAAVVMGRAWSSHGFPPARAHSTSIGRP